MKTGGSSGFNGTFSGYREYDDGISNNNIFFHEIDIQGNYISTTRADESNCLMFVIKSSSSHTFRWDHNKC